MPRISRLDRSQVNDEVAHVYDHYMKVRGNVPNMMRTMAHRPEILRTMNDHFRAVLETGTVPLKLKELLIVRTSQINDCKYWLASHTVLARRLGWTDDQLQNLADFESRQDLTAREKVALRLADRVTQDARTVDDELWNEVRQHFDEGEVVELLCAIGLFNYFNRFNDALNMEPTK